MAGLVEESPHARREALPAGVLEVAVLLGRPTDGLDHAGERGGHVDVHLTHDDIAS